MSFISFTNFLNPSKFFSFNTKAFFLASEVGVTESASTIIIPQFPSARFLYLLIVS